MKKEAIKTDHLTKFYGTFRGIDDLTLTVPEGDFFGFIGPNGAGKSTTIRTLLGLISPTKGTAKIFGKDIRENKTEDILSDIGYLPSEIQFYSRMKVKDILRFSAGLHHKNCEKAAKGLCERLEIDPSRRADELSLGNRKKVGIIACMQHDPKLYIMDEPTSGLDPLMQREFFSLLQEKNRQGATIFLSSHVLSEVQKYCSHAAIIREGKLLVSDSVEKLGHSGVKRILIRGLQADQTDFLLKKLNPDHIKDVSFSEESFHFLYDGDPSKLLKELSPLPLKDLTITEPDLEEIVLHYYL